MKCLRSCLILLVCFTFSGPAHTQENKKNYAEAYALIEAWLETQYQFDNLPGISVAVVEDQDLLWAAAFGQANPEAGRPMEKSTLCSICSISKLFTAVAVMQLYEQGKLRLDDRVADLLPVYAVAQQYPDSGPITVRSLLTHSSGLPREAAYPYWTGEFYFPTREEIDARLSDQTTLYPASTYYQYSNLALTLLGEIVEEVSQMPYDEYVKQNILNPLNLGNTYPEMPAGLHGKDLSMGYTALLPNGKRNKLPLFQSQGIAPAAGYASNVLDLAKFASWQFRLRDTTVAEILKPATLRYMQQVHFTDPGWEVTRGLGFGVWKGPNGTTWVGHGGSCPGYRSTLQLDLKNKRAYTAMINASGTNPGKYTRGVYQILSKVETIKEDPDLPDLTVYTGRYSALPWWYGSYIGTWNGRLVVMDLPEDRPGNDMTFLKHIDGDTFKRVRDDGELGEEIVFFRDTNGRVIYYKVHDNVYKKM